MWDEMFLLLEDYRDVHGTVEVKNTLIFRGMSLGRWVKTQRESQAKGKLPRIVPRGWLTLAWSGCLIIKACGRSDTICCCSIGISTAM
ncbi:helicase associated domain-containing protein [Arthrobacter alpinus]|uniref:helicase associated domain-containing protein n=1 Tax=Arthrobacter alpinus TaxID=656366 RepID=UPI001114B717